MRRILDSLARLDPDEGWAIARVTQIFDSAPVRVGDAMAVSAGGVVVGSLSAGCLDAAVVNDAIDQLRARGPVRHVYPFRDDLLQPGAGCSGSVEIAIEPLTHAFKAELERVRDEIANDREATLETPLVDAEGFFVQRFPSRPQMIIVGATPFAAALSSVARLLGYRVTVCDPRAAFAKSESFPDADEVLVGWGEEVIRSRDLDERTAICLLTHDLRSDAAALASALDTPAAYIGALGSRATQTDRRRRLLALGVKEESLGRISAPIGLHLGALEPEEVAIAIAAEIVQLKRRGSGRRLSEKDGPLHDRAILVDSDRQRAQKAMRAEI